MTRLGLTAAALLCLGLATPAAAQRFNGPFAQNGVLGTSDPRDATGSFYDEYRIQIAAGQRIRIEARRPSTGGVDPVVEIYAPGSTTRPDATDDDSGGIPNARLDYTAPRTGTYRVRVRAFSTSSGAYDLRITERPAEQAWLPLRNGDTAGSFVHSGPTREGGAHYRDYRFTLAAGEFVVLRLNASFDAYLLLYEAGSEGRTPLAINDDFGGSVNSAILFRAPRAGTYTVRASSLGHHDGAFTLRLDRLP